MRVTTEVTLTGDNFQVECYIPHYFLRSCWVAHLNKHLISSSEDYQVSTVPCIVPFFLYLNISRHMQERIRSPEHQDEHF